MTLTIEDLKVLKAPFKLDEHEFLRSFAYITELAITERIEQVDPAWNFEITSLTARPTVGTKNQVRVTCIAALTINGITRYGVGQDIARTTKPYKNKETGEFQIDEANEAEKSAATDALKRAARLFGIGRYLLNLKNVNGESQLKEWLSHKYGLNDSPSKNGKSQPKVGGKSPLTGGNSSQPQEPTGTILDDPRSGDGYTKATSLINTYVTDSDKRYHRIAGASFWGRDPLRDLGFTEDELKPLETVGEHHLPYELVAIYEKNSEGYKNVIRLKRVDTAQIVIVKAS